MALMDSRSATGNAKHAPFAAWIAAAEEDT
jgi:hypothetical protein